MFWELRPALSTRNYLNYSRGRRRRNQKHTELGTILVRCLAFLVAVGICVFAVRRVSAPVDVHRQVWPQQNSLAANASYILTFQTPQVRRAKRLVYPYSVVPGGISTAQELREAAAHDPVIAKHYAGFNYNRARLIEVKQPQKVYLSYRLKGKIFWTSKQAMLRVGEKLLTDGTTTCRTRCANQVSVLPQADIAAGEPPMSEFDHPDALASGTSEGMPLAVASDMLHLDPPLSLLPSRPPGGVSPGQGLGGGLPPMGGGPGGPGGGPGGGGGPPPPPPPVTPEPGTIVLVLSGAGVIFARYRARQRKRFD